MRWFRQDNLRSPCCAGPRVRGSILVRALVILAAALGVSVAHSWAFQAGAVGDRPVVLGVDETALQVTVLPPASRPGAAPEVGEGPSGDEDPAGNGAQAGEVLGFEITVDQAARLYDAGIAAFFDARLPDEFEAGHIDGASFVNAGSFDAGIPMAVEFVTPDQPIVIYCGGGECDASHNLAAILQQFGYSRLHIMVEGYPAWEAAGLPTAAGPDPLLDGMGG